MSTRDAVVAQRALAASLEILSAWEGAYMRTDDGHRVRLRTAMPIDAWEARYLIANVRHVRDVDQRWRIHQVGPNDWVGVRIIERDNDAKD
jgi:hypothetical protein